ncbi:MAG: PAS domain S-box protein, partial [Caulobacteraceae bacterium]|nr:PAS domain S-box protein [Caulobacteraceae bacterium]
MRARRSPDNPNDPALTMASLPDSVLRLPYSRRKRGQPKLYRLWSRVWSTRNAHPMTDLDDGIEAEAARWFFASSEDVFVILQMGEIQRVNPAWTALTGWEASEARGQSFESYGHPEDREALDRIVSDLRQHGQARAVHRLRRKSGDWVWV